MKKTKLAAENEHILKIKLYHFLLFFTISSISQITYIENFNSKGIPTAIPNDSYWKYFNDIHPSQDSWDKFIPGDGFAYIKVDADVDNDTDYTYPYQTLVFGGSTENHRLEVRMKGAVVDGGLVGFIFTYAENIPGTIFNEVDIEVVANDRDVDDHDRHSPNGWTDARFNTWRNASTTTFLPISGSAKPVVNANNEKISLIDDAFHTFTIDWRDDQVDYFIDGVLQESFNTNVATGWGEVIVGFRQLPWARDFNWTGEHTLVIDYFKIEPLSALSVDDYAQNKNSEISIFPNPAYDEITIVTKDFHLIEKIVITNVIGNQVAKFSNYQNKISIDNLSKGIYFVNSYFKNGTFITKKVVKQ